MKRSAMDQSLAAAFRKLQALLEQDLHEASGGGPLLLVYDANRIRADHLLRVEQLIDRIFNAWVLVVRREYGEPGVALLREQFAPLRTRLQGLIVQTSAQDSADAQKPSA